MYVAIPAHVKDFGRQKLIISSAAKGQSLAEMLSEAG